MMSQRYQRIKIFKNEQNTEDDRTLLFTLSLDGIAFGTRKKNTLR